MNISGASKTTLHARVIRSNGKVENLKYLSGGGIKGKVIRFWRKMKGVI
jgi:hypothetical protein